MRRLGVALACSFAGHMRPSKGVGVGHGGVLRHLSIASYKNQEK